MTSVDPTYIVFVRLPFPRGDFVDPPFVEWDASKDKQLWKIVSNASTNNDLDWNKLASKFVVPLPFLLQQVAWLYEQQMQQVQAQIRKVRVAKGIAVASTSTGSKSEHDEEVVRPGSGATAPRISSSLAHRRETPNPIGMVSSGGLIGVERIAQGSSISINTPTTAVPPLSCLSSANTTTTTTLNAKQLSPRLSYSTLSGRVASPKTQVKSAAGTIPQSRFTKSRRFSLSDSSSSESLTNPEIPILSPVIRRPIRHTQNSERLERAQDDDDDEPAFMPFSLSKAENKEQALQFSSNENVVNQANQIPVSNKFNLYNQIKAASLESDPVLGKNLSSNETQNLDSPKRLLEVDGRGLLSKGKNKEATDGTPSMGSSFSDLEDASITESALEEALASNMQAGGMASRMSTISQAIRSKYL